MYPCPLNDDDVPSKWSPSPSPWQQHKNNNVPSPSLSQQQQALVITLFLTMMHPWTQWQQVPSPPPDSVTSMMMPLTQPYPLLHLFLFIFVHKQSISVHIVYLFPYISLYSIDKIYHCARKSHFIKGDKLWYSNNLSWLVVSYQDDFVSCAGFIYQYNWICLLADIPPDNSLIMVYNVLYWCYVSWNLSTACQDNVV